MAEMITFVSWFLSQLPAFLLSAPISAFTGLSILAFVVAVTRRMLYMGRR